MILCELAGWIIWEAPWILCVTAVNKAYLIIYGGVFTGFQSWPTKGARETFKRKERPGGTSRSAPKSHQDLSTSNSRSTVRVFTFYTLSANSQLLLYRESGRRLQANVFSLYSLQSHPSFQYWEAFFQPVHHQACNHDIFLQIVTVKFFYVRAWQISTKILCA
jgi:hypothetical protein